VLSVWAALFQFCIAPVTGFSYYKAASVSIKIPKFSLSKFLSLSVPFVKGVPVSESKSENALDLLEVATLSGPTVRVCLLKEAFCPGSISLCRVRHVLHSRCHTYYQASLSLGSLVLEI
jgi:hypothetical protein